MSCSFIPFNIVYVLLFVHKFAYFALKRGMLNVFGLWRARLAPDYIRLYRLIDGLSSMKSDRMRFWYRILPHFLFVCHKLCYLHNDLCNGNLCDGNVSYIIKCLRFISVQILSVSTKICSKFIWKRLRSNVICLLIGFVWTRNEAHKWAGSEFGWEMNHFNRFIGDASVVHNECVSSIVWRSPLFYFLIHK